MKVVKVILIVALIVLCALLIYYLIIGGDFMFGRKAQLIKYEYSSGGDMRGSSHEKVVYLGEDGYAYVSFANASWYAEDPTVKEYKVDAKILPDIEAVFRRYGMWRWAHRRISNVFVADGPSYSHSFDFLNRKSVWFSAQYYPFRYARRLKKIDEIIDSYVEKGELVPGLVMEKMTEEEMFELRRPSNGEVGIAVYSYGQGRLRYRILNGTKDSIAINGELTLTGSGAEEAIANDAEFHVAVSPNSTEEFSIEVPTLAVGTYKLAVGEYSVEFEIK